MLLVTQVHFYLVTLDFDGKRAHRDDSRQGPWPPRLDVEAGAVTRAFDLVANKDPLAEWATIVAADIVNRVEGAADVREGYINSVDGEDAHLADGHIIYRSHPLECHHP